MSKEYLSQKGRVELMVSFLKSKLCWLVIRWWPHWVLAVVWRLSGCGVLALERTGSVLAAHGLRGLLAASSRTRD